MRYQIRRRSSTRNERVVTTYKFRLTSMLLMLLLLSFQIEIAFSTSKFLSDPFRIYRERETFDDAAIGKASH